MKEIELKAHAPMSLKSEIDDFTKVEAESVEKLDLYFRRPGETIQALRVRVNNDHLELTAKKQRGGEVSEDNLEYEVMLDVDQRDNAISFFKCLGFEEYFIKHKRGYSWQYGDLHIELLDVNDLGGFLEIEALLDYDASLEEVKKAQEKILNVLDRFGLRDKIERTSYREMIINGIQS